MAIHFCSMQFAVGSDLVRLLSEAERHSSGVQTSRALSSRVCGIETFGRTETEAIFGGKEWSVANIRRDHWACSSELFVSQFQH